MQVVTSQSASMDMSKPLTNRKGHNNESEKVNCFEDLVNVNRAMKMGIRGHHLNQIHQSCSPKPVIVQPQPKCILVQLVKSRQRAKVT